MVGSKHWMGIKSCYIMLSFMLYIKLTWRVNIDVTPVTPGYFLISPLAVVLVMDQAIIATWLPITSV